jgi:tyrosine aminotransferase
MPGIKPRQAEGAMYLMVQLEMDHFPQIETDLDFVQTLIREQSVFCMPASVFMCPNYVRIVITMHKEKIMEACDRIEVFIRKYYVANPTL